MNSQASSAGMVRSRVALSSVTFWVQVGLAPGPQFPPPPGWDAYDPVPLHTTKEHFFPLLSPSSFLLFFLPFFSLFSLLPFFPISIFPSPPRELLIGDQMTVRNVLDGAF